MKPEDFTRELNEFIDQTGITQEGLSEMTGVSQSQISDWKNGRIKRLGGNPRKLLNVIQEYRKNIDYPMPEVIQQAVRKVWSGKDEDAVAIAQVVESLTPFVKPSV